MVACDCLVLVYIALGWEKVGAVGESGSVVERRSQTDEKWSRSASLLLILVLIARWGKES